MPLFSPRKKQASGPPTPVKQHNTNGFGRSKKSSAPVQANLSEFGRPQTVPHHASSPPSYVTGPRKAATGLRRSYSDASKDEVRRVLAEGEELQLKYGYWGIETERELDLVRVEEVVRLCGEQIRSRGLDLPLLFSSRALDISFDGVASLIRSYLGDQRAWRKDIQFAHPHNLCGLIKWALGRITTPQGGRGFLTWELYEMWRNGEREKGYPVRYITSDFLYHLPTSTSSLLTTLLNLLSSAAAYTVKNGTTPRKLAALFGGYIFGLPDDLTFESTYVHFLRFSHATEHLLLAFIRDSKESSGGHLASRLEDFIKSYPADLPNNFNRASPVATLVPVHRIRAWEVPRSTLWASMFPLPCYASASTLVGGSSTVSYSPKYRHLLRIVSEDSAEDPSEMQRYKNTFDKEWDAFSQAGFSSSNVGKLKFDLNESERSGRRKKHTTMDWSTFASSGFGGRETYLPTDLSFDRNLSDSVSHWPEEKSDITERLRKTEKELPPFEYDITPHEQPVVPVDELFFETWADVLVASGWTRDEVKESNWALIQLRCRPKGDVDAITGVALGGDGRIDEKWLLMEEVVPADYLKNLQTGKYSKSKGKKSFLRTVRRKPNKQKDNVKPPAALPYSSLSRSTPSPSLPSLSSRPVIDDSVFAPGSGGTTKFLTMSERQVGVTPAITPVASPSNSRPPTIRGQRTSTFSAKASIIPEEAPPVPPIPAQPFMGFGVGGTLSSQKGEMPPVPDRGLGYNKPPSPRTKAFSFGLRNKRPIAEETEFSHETRSLDEMSEVGQGADSNGPPLGPLEGDDSHWVDVIRSPESETTTPAIRVRIPTAEDVHRDLPSAPSEADADEGGEDVDESPYEGIASEDEVDPQRQSAIEDGVIWRGSLAPESAPMKPRLPRSDSLPPEPEAVPINTEPEMSGASQKVARLISLYSQSQIPKAAT